MTASCTSAVFPKNNNSKLWNTEQNMLTSPYSRILHDPECQNNCCSETSDLPMQVDSFNETEQYPNITTYYTTDSILTSSSCGNQFFYDVDTSNDHVPKFQEVHRQSNTLGLAHSQLVYEKPIKTKYALSMITSAESRSKQRTYCKGVMKRKRKRTVFNTEQIVVMEGVFKKRPYISKEERLFLAQQLNISEKAIKIWFQNRRRVTEKRDRDQSDSYQSDSTIEETVNDYNSRLDYIESEIRENTDEYGFVTLGGKALTELVKLIDGVLSYSSGCQNIICENLNKDSYLMYEPVSPESLSDDNMDSENILKWEPSQPEESLQRLIDIHTVLYS